MGHSMMSNATFVRIQTKDLNDSYLRNVVLYPYRIVYPSIVPILVIYNAAKLNGIV